ncbi:MAG TPA: hypothetical protein PLI53_01655, partial [Geobacteraceae bacterium]|nr:hypothetical protein [Geobacteraceae bacterium]
MIRVQIPEHNTHVDFPDGTDPAEMQRVLQENFPAKSQAIPAEAKQVVSKDLGFPASSGSRTEVMGIATPQDREAARKIRESIAGVDRSKPRTHGPTEISTAPAQNIFERGLTAVRRALSPYDNSEAMDPGDIASAQISLEAKKHTVPAKTVDLPGGAKYTFPEHSMSVPAYKKHVLPEKEGIRRVERFGLGIGQGIKGVGTGLLGAAEWAGSENAGKAATAIEANEIGNAQDTGLSGELGAGFGSMLSFLIPSTGVSKAISLTSKLSSTAAKVGGAASMAAFEGATEAGSVYRDMKRRGHSDKEASEAATKVFLANLPLNFVTDKLAFFPDHAANTALKRGL